LQVRQKQLRKRQLNEEEDTRQSRSSSPTFGPAAPIYDGQSAWRSAPPTATTTTTTTTTIVAPRINPITLSHVPSPAQSDQGDSDSDEETTDDTVANQRLLEMQVTSDRNAPFIKSSIVNTIAGNKGGRLGLITVRNCLPYTSAGGSDLVARDFTISCVAHFDYWWFKSILAAHANVMIQSFDLVHVGSKSAIKDPPNRESRSLYRMGIDAGYAHLQMVPRPRQYNPFAE
jgi:hypothetical protein